MTSLLLLSLSSFLIKIESFFISPPSTGFLSARTSRDDTDISILRTTSIIRTTLHQNREENQHHDSLESFSIPYETIKNDKKYNVSLLLIDHYDSFTYNLYDMFAQLTIEPPVVVTKDAIDSASLFDDENGCSSSSSSSFFDQFDGIVLSPGPGTPQEQPPLSHLAISNNPDMPILGVCLGHQLMALAYGGSVDRSPVPIHGQDHRIVQQGQHRYQSSLTSLATPRFPSLFHDLPTSFRVVRYHSLCAYDLPGNIKVTAKSLDEVVQGIQHEIYPHYGVQFHPESIGTENGMMLLENFVRVVQKRKDSQNQPCGKKAYSRHVGQSNSYLVRNNKNNVVGVDGSIRTPFQKPDRLSQGNYISDSSSSMAMVSSLNNTLSSSRFRVMVHRLSSSPSTYSPLQSFEKYYAHQSHAIWLDSSSYPSRGELDIMATSSRPEDIIEYHLNDNDTNNDTISSSDILSRLEKELFTKGQNSGNSYASYIGWVKFSASNNDENEKECDILEWVQENDEQGMTGETVTDNLPFHYRGGFLGFLGYEVRHDTQQYLKRLEGGYLTNDVTYNITQEKIIEKKIRENDEGQKRVPTAAFFLARQSMVYHHPTDTWYLIGLVEDSDDIKENIEWMKRVDADMMNITNNELFKSESLSLSSSPNSRLSSMEFVPNRSKAIYKNDIAKCHEYIKKGDSYELCLTNQLEAHIYANVSTFDLYRIVRQVNPAPYSAYLRWNIPSSYIGKQRKIADVPTSTSLVICSSSPERFMSVSRQQPRPKIPSYLQAEAKPIKGTCARVVPQNGVCLTDAELLEDDRRARSLELSLKNRAENLMIVDLLRNDMSRVCKTGTVHVSKLMDIESFATVHQMVSTIRGTLSDSCNSIDLLRASFPGGSMTGAPKIRTMEILEELEQNVERGPYAGSIGYLSVNGCMDMNIMIRSATVTPSEREKGEWKVSVGAGGAITVLSDAEDEYDEMRLKARAVLEAVERWASLIEHDKRRFDDAEITISNSTEILSRS